MSADETKEYTDVRYCEVCGRLQRHQHFQVAEYGLSEISMCVCTTCGCVKIPYYVTKGVDNDE